MSRLPTLVGRWPVSAHGRGRASTPRFPYLQQFRAASALLHVMALLALFKLYTQLNAFVAGQAEEASDHAAALVRLEQSAGLFVEPRFQAWVRDRASFGVGGLSANLWNCLVYVYAHGHITWLATMLLWVYLFRRRHFGFLAALAHLSTFIAVLLRALYPVAPPRFALAGPPYRMIDATGVPLSEQVYAHFTGFDALGAMPSVHVLWALTTALGLCLCTDRWLPRVACLAFPGVIIVAVIATGNHYLLDCVGALLVLGVSALTILAARSLLGRLRPVLRGADQSPRGSPLVQAPFVLCGLVGVVLLLSGGTPLHLLGAALLISALYTVWRCARHGAPQTDVPLPHGQILSGGFLLVAGVTLIDADNAYLRLCGALLWLGGCTPLLVGVARQSEATHRRTMPTSSGGTSYAADAMTS